MLSRKRKVQNRLSGEELIKALLRERFPGSLPGLAHLPDQFRSSGFPDQDSDDSGPDEALRKKIRLTQPGG
jgi:hypothetical protein